MLGRSRELGRILRAFDWGPQQVLERTKSLMAYQIFEDFAFSPKRVLFYLTYKCNLRCKMCWWWGESGVKPSSPDLSLTEITTIIDRISRYKPSVSFTGGEVLTRKDILPILEHAKGRGLRTEIFTNGTLVTSELAKRLAGLVDRFMFSLEGPQAIHDHIRGEGSFEKTTRAISLVREAATESQREVSVRFNCVVSSLSLPYLREAVEVARSLGCHVTFQHLMFTTEQKALRHTEFLRDGLGQDVDSSIGGFVTDFHEVDVDLLLRTLAEARELADRLRVPFSVVPFLKGEKGIREWYTGVGSIRGMRCVFPWAFLYVKPNGDVAPCEFINYRLGNVLYDDVGAIWNGSRARRFRRSLKKGMFPGCTRCCELLPWPLP
ncbi:MAG: radical SAM protein [Chloroflexi bacterium]|nr:radical SAM protein [Chloroflexota bacterium]